METSSQSASASARTILVVDDDDGIRQLICTVLQKHGYSVLPAANAANALRTARVSEVDLVVTDIIMPGMTGPELVVRLRSGRPDLKVLFISGYSGDTALNDESPRLAFIAKPFRIIDLLAQIERLLGGSGA